MERKSAEIGEIIYGKVIRPFLLKAVHNDPEKLHKAFLSGLHWIGERERFAKAIERILTFKDPALEQKFWGLDFPTPIGLAAGLDKNGKAVRGISVLNVGFHEIGTTTPGPQIGFEQPRIWYLEQDKALINKMGFPNDGADAVARRLIKIKKPLIPVGVNIGKGIDTPIEKAANDYILCLQKLYRCPVVSFFTGNFSCPHMPGMCELQEEEYFSDVISAIQGEITELARQTGISKKPFLVKISPDDEKDKLDKLLDVCLELNVDGIIAVNTSLLREGLKSPNRNREGGLSGKPLFRKAINTVEYVSEYTEGKITIVGAGGISDAGNAYEMFKAGASLIQIYTGFVYNIWKGPFFFREISQGIKEMMGRDGIKRISEIRK